MTKRKPSEVTSGVAKRRVSSGRLPVPEVPSAASQGEECKVQVYVAYPTAMRLLRERLQATPEEMAAWIDIGPEAGGIAAYVNANELDPPPRFSFPPASTDQAEAEPDYMASLMKTWYRADDLTNFDPAERYVTGAALITCWSKAPDMLSVLDYIRSKISEGQLEDLHPVFGRTAGTFLQEKGFPPLESALFAVSQVRAVEASELSGMVHVKAPETPKERRARLRARRDVLKSQGKRDFLKRIAEEEGRSISRIKDLLSREPEDDRSRAGGTSTSWTAPVSRQDTPVSKPKKPKRR